MKNTGHTTQRISKRQGIGFLLKPFSWLYGLGTTARNALYDSQLFDSKPSPQFSVVVGNLTVGGTGKTPMVEYLIRALQQENKIITLSRGYGRQSRGFVLATSDSTAAEIGDEPLQYYEKFGQKIPVAVCENRLMGAELLNEYFPAHDLLLLDDAFQHRALRPDLAILLNDFNRPFYEDDPFPGGRLRENRGGAKRADAIVTTKCPTDLSNEKKEEIRQKIAQFTAPGTPFFFASVCYGAVRDFNGIEISVQSVVLVTGIAQSQPLEKYVADHFDLVHAISFSDHHAYSLEEVADMLKSLKNNQMVLTTEKDKVKLRPLALELAAASRFCSLGIEVNFGSETESFRAWLQTHIVEPLKARSVSV